MPTGLVEVGGLLVLTVIVLPCCFFTLLALLDRFERSLALDGTAVLPMPGAPALELAPDADAVIDLIGASVTALPLNSAVGPAATQVAGQFAAQAAAKAAAKAASSAGAPATAAAAV